MNTNTFLKDSLTFSQKSKIGILVLVILILIAAFWPMLYTPKPTTFKTDTAWIRAANELVQRMYQKQEKGYTEKNTASFDYNRYEDNEEKAPVGNLFPFDPNAVSADDFKRLGLRDRTIQILMNYRNKGGRFRKPDDFKKIYGLKPAEFARLRPFIQIQEIEKQADNKAGNHFYPDYKLDRPKYQSKIIKINSADTTAYKSLYGIGSKLAARIVNFREKLGGFYRIEQVGETYGVPDSVFQKIKGQLKVEPNQIRKININLAGYEALNNHPYISGKLAYQILKWRKEKGNFTSIEEIKEPIALTTDSYEKVSNYLTLE